MATSEIAPARSVTTVPRLEPGDRLDRYEFERRYRAMPDCRKAELIEGVVYMPSPVRLTNHGQPHFDLIAWLGIYRAATPGVMGADNATVRLDLDNEPQPDCLLFIRPELGGQVRISADDYLVGPPEFVAEISGSIVACDRGPKLRAFLRHGVLEYLLWRVDDRKLEWYALRDADYLLLTPDAAGVIRSEVFPGMWMDVPSLLAGNHAAVLQVLQQGIASPEHQAFVNR